MPATVRLLLLLGLLAVYAQAEVFRFEAHLSEVSLKGLRHLERRRNVVREAEKLAVTKFSSLFGEGDHDLSLHNIEIHGLSAEDPLPVINGYLTTHLTREEIISRLHVEESGVTLYFLNPVDSVPEVEYDGEVGVPVTYCKNGGALFPNATCACPPFYSGDHCELPVCLNGGIFSANQKCVCPPGFHSEHCEARSCSIAVEDNLDIKRPTFYYVVSLKDTMGYDLNGIIPNTKNALAKLTSSDYFSNFVLTSFLKSPSGTYMRTQLFSTADDFYKALTGLVISVGTPTQPILAAMNQTIRTFDTQKGRAFLNVFADSDASDTMPIKHDITATYLQNQLLSNLLYWRIHPVMILTGKDASALYATNTTAWKVLVWLAEATHGDIYLVQKPHVGNVVDDVLPLHIKVENLYVVNNIVCNSLTVDVTNENNSAVYFNLYNPSASLNSVDDDGKKSPLAAIHAYGNLQTYKLDPTKVKKVAAANADATQQCGARMFLQSDVSILNAFAINKYFDNGDVRLVAGLPVTHNAAVLGASPKTLEWQPLSTNDSTTLHPIGGFSQRMDKLAPCTFGWQEESSTFACTPGPFTSQFTTGDGAVRLQPNYCFTAPSGPAPTLKCQNGGSLVNGACRCTVNYKGNVCQTPICANGGTVNQFPGNGQPVCLCNNGFLGTFCDILTCNSTSRDDIDTSTRSFAIAVRTSYSLAYLGSQFTSLISTVVSGVPNDYYTEYILTTFNAVDKNTTNIVTEKFNDAASFKNFSSLSFGYSSVSDAPVMSALYETLTAMSKPRSAIYIIVDTPIKTENGTTVDDVKKYAIEKGIRINTIVAPPFKDITMCLGMSDINIYQDLSASTGGVTFDLCRDDSDLDAAFKFAGAYSTTYDYQMEVAAMNVLDCSSPVKVTYQRDLPTQKFDIIVNSVTAKNLVVQVSNGSAPVALKSMSDIPSLGIFDTKDISGFVTVTVSGGGSVCTIQVLEQSPLSAFVTFSSNPSVDTSSVSPQLQEALFPVVRLSTALQSRPAVQVDAWEKGSSIATYSSGLLPRQDSCLYDQYAQHPFACTHPNEEFFVKVIVQTPELTVSRTVRAFCRVSVDNCLNGGSWNGTVCMCSFGYSGKNCEIKQCQNGGSFQLGTCACKEGFSGEFCEYAMCSSWDYVATHNALVHNFRTIAFGVEATSANLLSVNILALKIQQIMVEIQQDDVNTQYALVSYDDKGVRARILTPDVDRFIAAVEDLKDYNLPAAAGNVLTADAINTLHSMCTSPASQNPALIVLLTASNSNKPSGVTASSELKPREGTQINIIYNNAKVPPIFNATSPNFDYLNTMAYQSGGRILPTTTGSLANAIDKTLASMLRAHALVSDAALLDCTNTKTPLSLEFDVETAASELYIDVVGYTASANTVLYDGAGKQVPIGSKNILYADTGSAIYKFTRNDSVTLTGKWRATTSTASGRCQIQARVRSPIRVNLGFTTDIHSDFPQYEPPYQQLTGNRSAIVTAQIPGLQNHPGVMLTGVDLKTKDFGTGVTKEIKTDAFIQRYPYGCANQFATDWMTLDTSGANYQMTVRGTDADGTDFTRTTIYTYIYRLLDLNNACVNSGTLDKHGFCQCASGWTGAHCTLPICKNGATRVGTACLCPLSYYGQFCETYKA